MRCALSPLERRERAWRGARRTRPLSDIKIRFRLNKPDRCRETRVRAVHAQFRVHSALQSMTTFAQACASHVRWLLVWRAVCASFTLGIRGANTIYAHIRVLFNNMLSFENKYGQIVH